jgi:hypothetical protein
MMANCTTLEAATSSSTCLACLFLIAFVDANAAADIGGDAMDATFRKHVTGILQYLQGQEEVLEYDQRLHGFELELSGFNRYSNGQIIANRLKSCLVDCLWNGQECPHDAAAACSTSCKLTDMRAQASC